MLRKLNIIYITLVILDVAIIPIVGFLQGFEMPATFIASLATVLLAHPLIYLIMMVVKTSMVDEYEAPKYMPLCMVLMILFGCIIWYCFFHMTFVFANTIGLWYGILLLSVAVPYFVYKILSYIASKKKKDQNGPKIIRNK